MASGHLTRVDKNSIRDQWSRLNTHLVATKDAVGQFRIGYIYI
jgi:hypothetical protein